MKRNSTKIILSIMVLLVVTPLVAADIQTARALSNVFAEIARAFPKAKSFKQIDPSAIPEDRTFRDALRFDGNRFIHDMTKAREIKRDHLRHARAPLFEQNDLALRDATLDNDRPKIETAKRRRDYLRNVTKDPRIEAARTTEELKEIEIE